MMDDDECGAVGGMKTCPIATLPTTIPTGPDLGSNPRRRIGKPAANLLSYGTASLYIIYIYIYYCVTKK
jgi:hypothetical protein